MNALLGAMRTRLPNSDIQLQAIGVVHVLPIKNFSSVGILDSVFWGTTYLGGGGGVNLMHFLILCVF